MDTDTFTPSLIAVCQMTHTHSLIGVCQIMCTDTLMHSLLHSLLSVKSHIQIHSHIHFTHCYVSNHRYKYTHTLTSLIAVKSHIQINSHTHTSLIAVCQIAQTDTLTHSLHSLLSVKSCIHIYTHSSISSELFNLLEPNVCVSVPHHEAECCEEMGLHSSALRSPWGLA